MNTNRSPLPAQSAVSVSHSRDLTLSLCYHLLAFSTVSMIARKFG